MAKTKKPVAPMSSEMSYEEKFPALPPSTFPHLSSAWRQKPRTATIIMKSTPDLFEFTCFGKLPVELRLKVWRMAANLPRIFDFDLIPDCGPYWKGVKGGLRVKAVRQTLCINQESRYETLQFFSSLKLYSSLDCYGYTTPYRSGRWPRGWQVPFNFEADILVANDLWSDHFERPNEYQRENYRALEKVRRIAVGGAAKAEIGNAIQGDRDYQRLQEAGLDHQRRILRRLQLLPNLEEIILYDLFELDFEQGEYRFLSKKELVNCSAGHNVSEKRYADMYEDFNKAVDLVIEKGLWKEGRPNIRLVGPKLLRSEESEEDSPQWKPLKEKRRLLYGN